MSLSKHTTCITDLRFDRFHAGELSGADERSLRTHLSSCARCGLRCDLLERQRTAFYLRAADWQSFAARRAAPPTDKRRAFGRGARWAVLSAAAALAVALFVRPAPDERVPSVRSKGGPALGFYVKQGEQVRRGASGERVRPGELVRFVYSVDRPAYFALLHSDTARASIYFPTGLHASAVEPGRDVALDFAIRLDSQLGAERVYGLFCAEPITLEPLRAQLETIGDLPSIAGCQVDRLVLHKEPE
jgi:hypothetical protein